MFLDTFEFEIFFTIYNFTNCNCEKFFIAGKLPVWILVTPLFCFSRVKQDQHPGLDNVYLHCILKMCSEYETFMRQEVMI